MTILQYIAKDDPDRAPPSWWWIVVAGVNPISEQVNINVVKLQEKNLLISQQRQELHNLAVIICAQIAVEGPFTETELNMIDKSIHIIYSR